MTSPRSSWRVYLLRCGDGSLYTGATSHLGRRLEHHIMGKGARYTRSRLPVKLVYEERAKDRGTALRREAALKRLTRAEKLALVAARRRRKRIRPRGAHPEAARPPLAEAGDLASLRPTSRSTR